MAQSMIITSIATVVTTISLMVLIVAWNVWRVLIKYMANLAKVIEKSIKEEFGTTLKLANEMSILASQTLDVVRKEHGAIDERLAIISGRLLDIEVKISNIVKPTIQPSVKVTQSVDTYKAYLEYARDNFAKTKVEKAAITSVISRVIEYEPKRSK